MEHREAVRKTIVTRVRVNHVASSDPFFPQWAVGERQNVTEVWWVSLSTRSGLLPERTMHRICFSKAEADDFVSRNPEGKELNDTIWPGAEGARQSYIRSMIDGGIATSAGHAGDCESPLAFDVLEKAGVTEAGYGDLSSAVLDCLGKRRIGELKNRFGENWRAAAGFEYCWIKFPESSPAYVAAAYQFHYYITGDDFAAGYLWRDLECLVHGVEAAAVKAIEMRKSAGEKGGKRAEAARARRRIELLCAMEGIVARNPDMARLGARTVSELAVQECVQANPGLWAQGRGQVMEYIGEMHRGEVGKDIRTRLHSMFPQTAYAVSTNGRAA